MNILPRKERLKKHELLIPIGITLLLIGSIHGFIKFKTLTSENRDLVFCLSSIACFFLSPMSELMIKIRITRPFNTLLWLVPAIIFYKFYDAIATSVLSAPGEYIKPLLILRLPFISLLYNHVMRLIHILLYNCEPLFVTWRGATEPDDESRTWIIETDKGFTSIYVLLYTVIFIIVLS